MLSRVLSAALAGLDAVLVEVEVDIASQGLPSFTIVGLPDKAVEEARERVRSALKNSGADFPAKRITVNLAPADLPKEGPSYDLPIAIGILIASGQIQADISKSLFMGELSLDGRVRPTNGVLAHALLAREKHLQSFYLPCANVQEASCIAGIDLFPVDNLGTVMLHLSKQKPLIAYPYQPIDTTHIAQKYEYDMKDIRGQEKAKRALEIAAAGGHNMLFKGPPGSGKTLLARTVVSILPSLTFSEVLEVTKIYSLSGLNSQGLVLKRPFRSPHHTTSAVGIIGGGSYPKPGEISLSHRSVLFLDELPEFPRIILKSLRQPLEDGCVTISRSQGRVTFPAKTMLLAAQNPCPCGYLGDNSHVCSCAPSQIIRYQKKISGPLLDRIDIHVDVPKVDTTKLTSQDISTAEDSGTIRQRVQKARDMQSARFVGTALTTNADMESRDIKLFCPLSAECIDLLRLAVDRMKLSARSYYRVIKLSRTIADLEASGEIQKTHIAEALQYRPRQNTLE
ncbi:MAG TPA: YifB family Mg chelatase-like AAA ATPase [Candidatus Saccharimonadales bacterium]|nr:YifB family Mg chelatase-like AAA ATPase [Candidatus Saccharimonadales bacterium]